MARLLVAASPGITNTAWLSECLAQAVHSPAVQVAIFYDHPQLIAALAKFGFSPKSITQASNAHKRTEIRKALDLCEHVLIFWDGKTLNELLFEARLKNLPIKLFATEVTQVVNKDQGESYDAYIGRGTPWGNPYPVGHQEGQHSREESIELFKKYFDEKLLSDPAFRNGLLGLKGLRLGCHCKPLACHGDIIANYLNSLHTSIDPANVQGT